MPYNRPSLKTIKDRVLSNIHFHSGVDAFLRFSLAYALGRAIAAMSHSLYGRILFLTYQLPHKAEGLYLEGWCGSYGIVRRPATKAVGKVTVAGIDGSTVDVGFQFSRSDSLIYTVTTGGTVAAGTLDVIVSCNTFGLTGNCDAGQKLTCVTPKAGINSSATVHADEIGAGVDIEDDETLRARLLDRIQYPPHGGTIHDYEQWTMEVSGVTRSWCYAYPDRSIAIGNVVVLFAMDNLHDTGIPTEGEVTVVDTYIRDNYKPACAIMTVQAPTALTVNLSIQISPSTDAIKASVTAAIKELFVRSNPGAVIYLSQLHEAISSASGEVYHVMTVPSSNVTTTDFQIPVLGTITWS